MYIYCTAIRINVKPYFKNGTVDIADFAALSYWWYDQCPADWPLK